LAYLSELRGGFDLNVMHLPFVWAAVSPFFPPANDLYQYQLRYQALLSRAGA
jgi:hypothetical protein